MLDYENMRNFGPRGSKKMNLGDILSMSIQNVFICVYLHIHSVDGRNPAPPGM